jgi:hypothetical protein
MSAVNGSMGRGYTLSRWRTIRARIAGSGSRPRSAPMFSRMWSTREVAGMTQVTAGWETMNLSRNWDQLAQSISAAQAGSGRP